MPKAVLIKSKILNFLREYSNETFASDNNVLYCNACNTSVSTAQKSQVFILNNILIFLIENICT